MKNQTIGKIEEYAGDEQAIFLTPEEASQVIPSGASFDSVDEYFNFVEKNGEQTEKSREPEIPSVDDGLPNYGISRISDVPARKNKYGVYIADLDKKLAESFIKLSDKFDIYRDRGVILIPEEMKMRVDLVDGWQD